MEVRPVTWQLLLPLLGVLFLGSVRAQGHTHGMDLSSTDKVRLRRQANDGDGAAAWRLYDYYAYERHNERAAEPWRRRAAELDHAQAQLSLAGSIKDYGGDPKGFGESAQSAVRHLLERSARTEGDACFELASAFAEGYFGSPDPLLVRQYFERGANFNSRMCWEELARYCHLGIGGPLDEPGAYYWTSLESSCVDPRSVGGEETWALREAIASVLSLPELEQAWARTDAFMTEVAAGAISVDFAPFLSGMIDPKTEAEGRQAAKDREAEHRMTWRSRKS